MKDSATSLLILGERNLNEFIRLNILGSLPSITSLRASLTSFKYNFVKGEFQCRHLKDFIKSLTCKYAFCADDCTSVVPNICYDTRSNCFVRFTLPLQNGLPSSRYFSTSSLAELETWLNRVDKSFLLSTHVIQVSCPADYSPPLPSSGC